MESASKEQEIKRRITLGCQAFGRASAIFKNKDIPIVLKRQVYDQCILPTVTYGPETWNLTKRQTLKLRTMQRAHERTMLNITWRDRKTCQWIREKTKVLDIMETISKLKWNWAGHVARRTDNRWTTCITFWTPRGHTRNRGRPKKRGRDDLDSFLKHWHRVAQNVVQWKSMGKAYVQRWTFSGWTELNWNWLNSVVKIKQFLVVISPVVKIKQFFVVINPVVKINQFLVVINTMVKIKQYLVVINTVVKIKQFLVVINTVVKIKQFLVVINTVVKIKQFLVVINTVVKINQFLVVINTVVKIKQFWWLLVRWLK